MPGIRWVGPPAVGDPGDGRQGVPPAGSPPRSACRRCRATTMPTSPTKPRRRLRRRIGLPVLVEAVRRRRRQGHADRPLDGDVLRDALAGARREARAAVRRRSADPRTIRRGAAARRDPGAVRRARRTASASANAIAPCSGGTRRSSRSRRRRPSMRRCESGWATAAVRLASAVGYASAGHRRVPARRSRTLLVPRDEHAAPGGASGDRGGHRTRPRRRPVADRGRRATRTSRQCRTSGVERPRRRGAPVRGGRRGGLPAGDGSRRRARVAVRGAAFAWTRAIAVGDEVGGRFDPMLAKIIAAGDRAGRGARPARAAHSTRRSSWA